MKDGQSAFYVEHFFSKRKNTAQASVKWNPIVSQLVLLEYE